MAGWPWLGRLYHQEVWSEGLGGLPSSRSRVRGWPHRDRVQATGSEGDVS